MILQVISDTVFTGQYFNIVFLENCSPGSNEGIQFKDWLTLGLLIIAILTYVFGYFKIKQEFNSNLRLLKLDLLQRENDVTNMINQKYDILFYQSKLVNVEQRKLERIKVLKDSVIEIIGHLAKYQDDQNYDEYINKYYLNLKKIQFILNPRDPEHNKLIMKIESIVLDDVYQNVEKMRDFINEVIQSSKMIIESEVDDLDKLFTDILKNKK